MSVGVATAAAIAGDAPIPAPRMFSYASKAPCREMSTKISLNFSLLCAPRQCIDNKHSLLPGQEQAITICG